MPGSKRRVDEDTWLVLQSKKLKSSSELENIYASTLARLRVGSRAFFSSLSSPSSDEVADLTRAIDLGEIGIERGMEVEMIGQRQGPSTSSVTTRQFPGNPSTVVVPICETCSRSGFRPPGPMMTCHFCEKRLCHVDPCCKCSNGFCKDCCLPSYEDSSGETFVCIDCLRK